MIAILGPRRIEWSESMTGPDTETLHTSSGHARRQTRNLGGRYLPVKCMCVVKALIQMRPNKFEGPLTTEEHTLYLSSKYLKGNINVGTVLTYYVRTFLWSPIVGSIWG